MTKINVRTANGDVYTFKMADGWHVKREGDDLVVRWHNEYHVPTDRVHVFAPGHWREVWTE